MSSNPGSISITATFREESSNSIHLPIYRLWIEVELKRIIPLRLPRKCLVDTGAPLCVIPYSIHAQGVDWAPLPGNWAVGLQTWMGVACDLGQVEVWLPTPADDYVGPFLLTAKFPRSMPRAYQRSKQKDPLPVLLGMNFFSDLSAEITFRCRIPDAGTVTIP